MMGGHMMGSGQMMNHHYSGSGPHSVGGPSSKHNGVGPGHLPNNASSGSFAQSQGQWYRQP